MWIDTAPSHLKPCAMCTYIRTYVCTLNTYSKHSTQNFVLELARVLKLNLQTFKVLLCQAIPGDQYWRRGVGDHLMVELRLV